MGFLQLYDFVMHSGQPSYFKIECDCLDTKDIETIAKLIVNQVLVLEPFGMVYGIPIGGLRIANALDKYCTHDSNKLLIVDDVLTTGNSMTEAKQKWLKKGIEDKNIMGAVIFARGKIKPKENWVKPLFQLWVPNDNENLSKNQQHKSNLQDVTA
jgi:orotate phosphoribosyltransferase